jgi:5-methylcytosine-specific restriction protein A
MLRKEFIESVGATCKNWQWSWSFINETERFIVFGAWDRHTEGKKTLIFSDDWEHNAQGNKNQGYKQSREHIRLIEEEGFRLMTFPMKYSDARKEKDGIGPAKIEGFTPILSEVSLRRIGHSWYADDNLSLSTLTEEIYAPEKYAEGAKITVTINAYERNAKARGACITHHGVSCAVCNFDFGRVFGDLGVGFIHVHHIVPISSIRAEYEIDPISDLVPVCPNCHAMIHRVEPPLAIEQLREHLTKIKNANMTVNSTC